jgi:hypothetical protein
MDEDDAAGLVEIDMVFLDHWRCSGPHRETCWGQRTISSNEREDVGSSGANHVHAIMRRDGMHGDC